MDRADLRKHLRFAQAEPVHVAFALGGDGKAILQMDRRKPPRALEKALKDEVPDSKSHRFGTAAVDPDDAKLVRFVVNKAGGGLARKLIVALKGTGFSKVQILLEDGTPVEQHEDDDETGDADAPDQGGSDLGEAPPGSDGIAGPGPDAAAQPRAETQVGGPPDPAELTRTLTGLVKRMLGVIGRDPSQKAALAELATDAQASLKRGDFDQAAAGIDILRQAIDAGAGGALGDGADIAAAEAGQPAAPAGPAHPAAPAVAKARLAWVATRTKLESDIGGLHGTFSTALRGHGMADELAKLFRTRVDTVFDALDDALAHKLDDVNNAPDPAQRAKHVQDAHALIQRYQAHVAADKTIALLDRNPFTPLAIGKTVNATLAALSKAIR